MPDAAPTTDEIIQFRQSGFSGGISRPFRLFHGTGLVAASNTASPGFDKLRWLKPVRPGDTLRVKSVVTSTRPSKGKPRGVVIMDHFTINQNDETVMSLECVHLLKRRDGKPAA